MNNNTVVVIMRHNTESYHGPSLFAAIASDEDAARQWIQDEVDGKHDNTTNYMQGKTAEWWIRYGTFSLETVTVH